MTDAAPSGPAPRRPGQRRPTSQRRKMRKIRAAVREGTYENALKLQVALDRLLDALDR